MAAPPITASRQLLNREQASSICTGSILQIYNFIWVTRESLLSNVGLPDGECLDVGPLLCGRTLSHTSTGRFKTSILSGCRNKSAI